MQTSSEPSRQRPQRTGGQGVTWSANQRTVCPASTNQRPAELLVMIYKSHQVASVFIQPINKFSNICSSADQGSDNGVDRPKPRILVEDIWTVSLRVYRTKNIFTEQTQTKTVVDLWSGGVFDSDHLKSENNETVSISILNILGQGRETESRVYSPSPQMYRQMVSDSFW